MAIYTVNCYNPPTSYSLEPGEKVKVKGWVYSNNQILAEKIIKLSKPEVTCNCSQVPPLPSADKSAEKYSEKRGRKPIETIGTVGKMDLSSSGIQFTLAEVDVHEYNPLT